MLSPKPISALEQIRATIKLHEAEARQAREDAEASLARAEQAEASAVAHEQTADQWRSILVREEAVRKMQDRIKETLITQHALHTLAEPETGWEAFISGKPNRRRILCSWNPGCICGRHGDGSTKGNEHG